MPKLEEELRDNNQLRLILYGPEKTKKTWWAGMAAEAGYNVHFINTDKGLSILRNISPEGRKRINVIDATDTMTNATGAIIMTAIMKGTPFVWDTDRKLLITRATSKGTINAVRYDISKLTFNDILVVDSLTALVQSIIWRFCIENEIDLSDAKKVEWEGYRWSGALLSWMIAQLKSIPCHIIVIGHQDVYAKTKTVMSNGRKETITEWTRLQLKSTSGPHAMSIGKDFTDILYFFTTGSLFKIDTAGAKDRMGGTRAMPPKTYNWKDLQFATLVEAAGLLPPEDTSFESKFEVKLTQEEINELGGLNAAANKPIVAEKNTATIKTNVVKKTLAFKRKP